MQYSFKEYDQKKHDLFKALTVRNPFAHLISKKIKKLEIRSKPTKFRGRVMITSSALPEIPEMISGAVLCSVEIYDCVQVSGLTKEEWLDSCLPDGEFEKYQDHFAWKLRDVKEIIEIPVTGNLGIWNLVTDKDELMEYPNELIEYMKQDRSNIDEYVVKTKTSLMYAALLVIIALLVYILLSTF